MIAISVARNSRKRSHHAAADESIAGWYWSILRDRTSCYILLYQYCSNAFAAEDSAVLAPNRAVITAQRLRTSATSSSPRNDRRHMSAAFGVKVDEPLRRLGYRL